MCLLYFGCGHAIIFGQDFLSIGYDMRLHFRSTIGLIYMMSNQQFFCAQDIHVSDILFLLLTQYQTHYLKSVNKLTYLHFSYHFIDLTVYFSFCFANAVHAAMRAHAAIFASASLLEDESDVYRVQSNDTPFRVTSAPHHTPFVTKQAASALACTDGTKMSSPQNPSI